VLKSAARRPESFAADGAGTKHADRWLAPHDLHVEQALFWIGFAAGIAYNHSPSCAPRHGCSPVDAVATPALLLQAWSKQRLTIGAPTGPASMTGRARGAGDSSLATRGREARRD